LSTPQSLQEGIYCSVGDRPGKFFCLLFLKADSSLDASTIGNYLSGLWEVYLDLKKGIIKDLPEHPVPSGNLTVLIGYGLNVFSLNGVKKKIPSEFATYGKFRSALESGGGEIYLNSPLRYSDDVTKNTATEDILVQFVADTQLSVNRCIIETWKYLYDNINTKTGRSPLLIIHFFSGFQRDDFRSMLDFHDGVSNMKAGDERFSAIAIKDKNVKEEKWTVNGTYLAFLRLAVNLTTWRKIPRNKQELIVGRDKLSGCPIVDIDSNENPILATGCPVLGTKEVTESGNEIFRDISVGQIRNNELRNSHLFRANLKRAEPQSSESLRIFRQGYEFLEQHEKQPGFRWGLNFVSFQDTPERLYRILTNPNWLGGINFGGNPQSQLPGMETLLSVRAGGIYLIPPSSPNEVFPGSGILI
jgi:deferrochelatase/peroxidase EfeB